MKRMIIALMVLLNQSAFAQQNPYENAWKALNENNRPLAEKLLQAASRDPQYGLDAYLSDLYLKSYNGKNGQIEDFNQSFYKVAPNPYPYIYALWFNKAVVGETGKKSFQHQVELVDYLIADERAPGTLVASANYQRGMHNLFSNDFGKTQPYFDALGNIRNWQYTGPFENLSESGYYKNYGPPDHPEPQAVFKSLNNADVKWITPAAEIRDGWTPVCYQFNKSTAVVYAQNFVNSAIDQTVLCNIGVSGSIKVWVNDELLIAESKERVTDMDTYTVKCNLKKGTNRVLIQLGYTNSSYPNFNLRFTDDRYRVIDNITGSSTYAAYPKITGNKKEVTMLPHFAEAFFQDKIAKQPDNLLNYLLLADAYLRSKRVIEARNLLTDAIAKAPANCLLKMKMVEVLIREDNRTLLLEELERIKKADPESLVVIDMKLKELFDNEKFEDGAQELEKRIRLFGEDETTAKYRIMILINDKKYEELVKEAKRMYAAYPENSKLVEMMYTIKKEVDKDNKGALKVYEIFLKDNYNYDVVEKYASILEERGNNSKALSIREKLAEDFSYSPSGYHNLSKYHFIAKSYNKAEECIRKALALAPYVETYWEQLGDIMNERGNTAEAMIAYNQSLKYDPNQYDIINKIRKLNGKPETQKLFEEVDIDAEIRKDNPDKIKGTDYGFYYIYDNKNVIIHPDGATEEYFTTLLRITNEKGVDRYKESSIGYNNTQNLLIEKAEVYKKNNSRIEGERNGNEIVFANLEVGDVIVFKYRTQSFVYGRFAKEYWDKYFFGGEVHCAVTRYNLLAPAALKINYKFTKVDVKPVVREVEDFKMYTWELKAPEPIKYEPLMPGVVDIAEVLHVSTVPAWKDVSDWYSDVSNNRAEEDFEIVALYKKLFPDGDKTMSQFKKARIIYDYIENNIRYSSVSFRQSAYVPQRASATLTTRLGDCKDLSSLFVTLAQMAGIPAQMVLVDTRDNGEKDMLLPCVEFNHCIVRALLDGKSYYIEMTDNYLPFTSLPNNLNGALILEIPSKNISERSDLKTLVSTTRTRDIARRVVDIQPEDIDLNVKISAVKYGNLSSGIRNTYMNLDVEKQKEEMERSVASGYKSNVKLTNLDFKNLEKLDDSIVYSYAYRVKNEISEIGALQTFRITYPDIVASLDQFSLETRLQPVEYWNYENADQYETLVNITAPAGKKFVELPKSETFGFKDMKFSLQYQLPAPDKLKVTRIYSCGRQNFTAAEYPEFKSFFEKIVRAEQKFIAYK